MQSNRNENAIKRALDHYKKRPEYARQMLYSNSVHKDAHLQWQLEQEHADRVARELERMRQAKQLREAREAREALGKRAGKSKRLKTKRLKMKRRKTRNKN